MPIVVQRSFIIERGTYNEFERLSREHIWPYMEARGCKIVGLFTNMHGGSSDEVILLTAYDSMTHWEATRMDVAPPETASEQARALHTPAVQAARDRGQLTLRTSTRVLRLATNWVGLGVHPG